MIDEAGVRGGEVDLSADVVVVPGARARRRLLALLYGVARAVGARLHPPRVLGLEQSEAVLIRRDGTPAADPTAVLFAIHGALRHHEGSSASLAQAQEIRRVHREIAAAGVGFQDAARATLAQGGDGARYLRMGEVVRSAQEALAKAGYVDPLCVIGEPLPPRGRVHLVAVVQPTARQRALFHALQSQVVAWCVAAPEHADRFDRLGGLVVDAWLRVEPSVDLDRVRLVDGPVAQAHAVHEWLARCAADTGGTLAADRVTLATADEEVASILVRELRAMGVGVHDARGVAVSDLPPARLLARLRDHLRAPTTQSLRRVAAVAALEPLQGTETLPAFDRWRTDHHDRALDASGPSDPGGDDALIALQGVIAQLTRALPTEARLSDCAGPIAALLHAGFGREANVDDRGLTDQAIASLVASLSALESLPESVDAEVNAVDALDGVLSLTRGQRVREEPRDDELDLVGWLELPLDEADTVMVAGFNEGAVPAAPDDPLLPDGLRRALGLVDAAARLARDRFVLSTLLARPRIAFTLGRRNGRGDPLAPSSLLLCGRGAELAARVTALTEPPPAPKPAAMHASRFTPPRPPDPPVALTRIPVSGFRAYLRCPYRFWLNYIVEVKSTEPAGIALDDRSFGIVVHDVLNRFGAEEREAERAAIDVRAIGERLERHLDAVLSERAGPRLGGGLRIQRQILRERLRWFAEEQARLGGEGWRILAVESAFQLTLPVPGGEPAEVRGRIDRVDGRRVAKGIELRVIDYKTSASARDPDEQHRKEKEGEVTWSDLQLPLYAQVVRDQPQLCGLSDEDEVIALDVGYLCIGATRDQVRWNPAEALVAQVDEAVQEAQRIVTAIRDARFPMNVDLQGEDDDPVEILCRTALQRALGKDTDRDADEGEEEES